MPVVGVISDTHSLLRDEALTTLRGSDLILHAGDIGSEDVISSLSEIAPVKAVRGNIDKGEWAARFPESESVRIEGIHFYLLHRIRDLDLDPIAEGIHVVVSGHSHKPSVKEIGGVTYLNPGSAGPRRFKLPICLARVVVEGESTEIEIIHLDA